jgi:simple sugar transport system permease protein
MTNVSGEAATPRRSVDLGWRVAGMVVRQREASILVVAIALAIYFGLSSSNFLTKQNFQTLTEFGAPVAIIAAGEVMLLICGEIDLSVGNTFALSAWVMYFAHQDGLPMVLAVVVGLLAAALVGLANGIVSVIVGVPSFITTLGMLFILNGFVLIRSHGFPVTTPGGHTFSEIMGVHPYATFYWAIAIIIVMHFLLKMTPWGLHTIAAGGNLLGASESGVNVRAVKIGNFVLCAVLGGFAGILESVRIASIDPLQGGTTIMFSAVAAAVIGGTSLMGGSGTIAGALIGCAVLSILSDGFTILGVNAYYFDLVQGFAILVAMVLNIQLLRLKRVGRLQ